MRRCLVLVGLAACGDGLTVPDAPPSIDAERSLVRVEVLSSQTFDRAPRVFFQSADSTLVLATETDRDGTANAVMPGGGFVTIVLVGGGQTRIVTQANVEAGETVRYDERSGSVEDARALWVNVPEDDGASTYAVYTTCGAHTVIPTEPTLIELFGCGSSGDMLVFSNALGFLYRQDLAFTPSSTITFQGPYQRFADTTVTATNVPLGISSVMFRHALLDGRRVLYPQSGLIELASVTDQVATATVQMPPLPGARTITQVTGQGGNQIGALSVLAWGAGAASVDVGARAVRRYLTYPKYRADANGLGWIEDTQGPVADGVVASIGWNGDDGSSYFWSVLAPRTEEAWVRFPVLPDRRLEPGANTFVSELVNFKLDGGYPRLRALQPLGTWHYAPLAWPLDADSGDVTFQSLNDAGGGEL